MNPGPEPITELLVGAEEGDAGARERLWRAVYHELRALARRQLWGEAAGCTLQPTVLVHEAYARLLGGEGGPWSNRRHLFGAAANAMRQIRVDDARRRKRLKRGGAAVRAELHEHDAPAFDQDPAEVLALDEALQRLEQNDPRKAEIVTLRYFAERSEVETAEALGVSRRTVQLEWRVARAWLHRELTR